LGQSELVYKLKNDDFLYFLHIQKTAGTTLKKIIDDHFDDESICPDHLWRNLVLTLPRDFSKYRLIRGHFGYGIHRILPKKPVYITMLRNPIELSLSKYEFVCLTAENNPNIKKANWDKESTFLEVLTGPKKRIAFENTQTRFLSKDLPSSFSNQEINEQEKSISSIFSSSVDSSDLDIAKQHLSQFPFFGLAERFEDSMFLLCYTFCWRPIRRITMKNVAKNRRTIKDYPNAVKDILEKWNELDANLYNFAQELFENRFNKMIAELKEKYYEPRYDGMQFKQMMYEMLEKHYEENYNHPQIKRNIDYNFRESISGTGWYSREKLSDGVSFRWIGPEPAEIDLPLLEKQQYKIQISIRHNTGPDSLKGLKFKINNQSIDMKEITSSVLFDRPIIFEGIIPKSFLNHEKKFTRLTLESSYTKPREGDGLHVGIAPNRIKIFPFD